MTTDDSPTDEDPEPMLGEEGFGEEGLGDAAGGDGIAETSTRDRLEAEADRAVEQFDQSIVDVLSWVLDTETRARIYIALRQTPGRTSEEIADATGLYPSTVRESLAELHDEGIVDRRKRENDGAGNNPYEYTAIPPSELVGGVVTRIQDQLNAICNLDRRFDGGGNGTADDPIRIEVREEESDTE